MRIGVCSCSISPNSLNAGDTPERGPAEDGQRGLLETVDRPRFRVRIEREEAAIARALVCDPLGDVRRADHLADAQLLDSYVRDEAREGWADVVRDLATEGRKIVLLTGDDERMTRRFAEHPDVDRVYADVRPKAKESIVRGLRVRGRTVMVGDGTNDAPALAAADLGVALGSGTDLAIDAADAVVVEDDLWAVPALFDIARRSRRRVRSNLWWATGYNAVAIPLAAVGVINPLLAALLMAFSSLLVVANSTRTTTDGGG